MMSLQKTFRWHYEYSCGEVASNLVVRYLFVAYIYIYIYLYVYVYVYVSNYMYNYMYVWIYFSTAEVVRFYYVCDRAMSLACIQICALLG